jgi:predicted Zn-dependent peptidase
MRLARRHPIPLLCLLALLLAPEALRAAPDLEDPAAHTRIETLDNGLTVLLLPDRSTPVVSFQVWVKAGSRDETRYTGIAHLFEHMMFKGTENLGPEDYTRYVEERGGKLNAYTSRDVTVYFEDVTAETLPLVIDLEAERMANLEVTPELLEPERQVVLEERRMRTEDQPQGRAFEALLALSFRAHAYRWPVIGWRSDVEAVPVEACRAFFDTYYAPNNLVVVVSGDFDPDATLAHITRAFGAMEPVADIPRSPTEEPEQRGERRDTVLFDVRAPLVMTAWHAPPTGHEDGPALDALSVILSSGRSSRLYRRLVNDEQVALSAGGGYWEMQQAGIFYGSLTVRPDAAVERAEALFFEEIERVRSEPVSEAELDKARRTLEVDLVEGLRTAHQLGRRIAQDWVSFGRIRPLEERLAAIRAVTAEDVQRVARTYLAPERRSVVQVVAPPDDASAAPAGGGADPS